jgi:hypothetical protein
MSKTLATIRDQAASIKRLDRAIDLLVSEAYDELSKWEVQKLELRGITKAVWCKNKKEHTLGVAFSAPINYTTSNRNEDSG